MKKRGNMPLCNNICDIYATQFMKYRPG